MSWARKAGTMGDQIADGHLFGEDGIVKFKCGKRRSERGRSQPPLPSSMRHAQVGDGKGFCDAGDGAERFRRHEKLFFSTSR